MSLRRRAKLTTGVAWINDLLTELPIESPTSLCWKTEASQWRPKTEVSFLGLSIPKPDITIEDEAFTLVAEGEQNQLGHTGRHY